MGPAGRGDAWCLSELRGLSLTMKRETKRSGGCTRAVFEVVEGLDSVETIAE